MRDRVYRFGWIGVILELIILCLPAALTFRHFHPTELLSELLRFNFGGLLYLILGGFPLILALYLLIDAAPFMLLSVQVNDQRLIYNNGFQIQTIAWEELKTVWAYKLKYSVNFIPITVYNYYRLERSDGLTVTIPRYMRQIDELGKFIQRVLVRDQAPKALAQLRAGQTVEFGPISIDAEGIHYEDGHIRWKDLKRAMLWSGQLRLFTHQGITPHAIFATSKVPNFAVLMAIIQTATRS